MDYIKRDIEKIILETSQSYSAILVTGPRQVGKTTTLRHLIDDSRNYVTLDDLEARRMAQSDPELFLSIHKAPILIDEVQYAPQLFSYIKIAVDNGAAPGSFWMTGSQAFRLMELAQESLAGRVAILHMSSLSQHEIYGSGEHKPLEIDIAKLQERASTGTKTDVNGIYERIWKGSLPGSISGKYPNRDTFYSSYLQSYVQRDIGDMVDRIDTLLFADFVRAAACRAGQMLIPMTLLWMLGLLMIPPGVGYGLWSSRGLSFICVRILTTCSNGLLKHPRCTFLTLGLWRI